MLTSICWENPPFCELNSQTLKHCDGQVKHTFLVFGILLFSLYPPWLRRQIWLQGTWLPCKCVLATYRGDRIFHRLGGCALQLWGEDTAALFRTHWLRQMVRLKTHIVLLRPCSYLLVLSFVIWYFVNDGE